MLRLDGVEVTPATNYTQVLPAFFARIWTGGTVAQFKALLDAAVSGDTIWVAGGTYNFAAWTTVYTLTKQLTFRGMGAGRAIFTGAANVNMFNVQAPIRFENCEFDTWQDTIQFNKTAGGKAEYLSFERCAFRNFRRGVFANNEVGAQGVEWLHVENSEFDTSTSATTGQGIDWQHPYDKADIIANRINDVQKAGIHLGFNDDVDSGANFKHANVVRNKIVSVVAGAGEGANGILVFGIEANIENNYVENVNNASTGAGTEGIYTKCVRASIRGNHLLNGGRGEGSINIKGAPKPAPPDPADVFGYETVCSGNTIRMTTAITSVQHGINVSTSQVSVTENAIEGATGDGITSNAIDGLDDLVVAYNKIQDCLGPVGIRMAHGGRGTKILHNQIDGVNINNDVSTPNAIRFQTNAAGLTDVQIEGNEGLATPGTATDEYAGILIKNANLTRLKIHKNMFDSFSRGITFIHTSGTLLGVDIDSNQLLSTFSIAKTIVMTPTAAMNVRIGPTNPTVPVAKTGNATLALSECSKTITNTGAVATITLTLPAAIRGLTYGPIARIASQILCIDPAGTEVIRGGGVGKYLSLDADGTMARLECMTDGIWEIISSVGTTSFEA